MSEPCPSSSVYAHMFKECEAMARYAFASGTKFPNKILLQMQSLGFGPESKDSAIPDAHPCFLRLGQLHGELARLVAPATPRGIMYMQKHQYDRLKSLGPIPLVRHITLIALLSIAAFIGISLSADINNELLSKSLFTTSGYKLLQLEMFLLSAAALGASFAALSEALRFSMKGTFDPKYNSSYWTRFVLGLISGLILSEVISHHLMADGNFYGFHKPVLAMLGGFSSELVFRILSRLVESLETVVRGSTRDTLENQAQNIKTKLHGERELEKLQFLSSIQALRQKLAAQASSTDLSSELDKIEDQLGFSLDRPSSPTPPSGS